jgi:hypothetical protein
MEKRFGRSIDNRWKLDWRCKSNSNARSIWLQQNYVRVIAVDVLVANLWMGFLLWDPKKDRIDKWLKADNTQIIALENQLEEQAGKGQPLSTKNLMVVLMVALVLLA